MKTDKYTVLDKFVGEMARKYFRSGERFTLRKLRFKLSAVEVARLDQYYVATLPVQTRSVGGSPYRYRSPWRLGMFSERDKRVMQRVASDPTSQVKEVQVGRNTQYTVESPKYSMRQQNG